MSLSRLAQYAAPPNPPAAPGRRPDIARLPTPTAAAESRDGFDALTRYIPTETITLFVAACSAFQLGQPGGFTGLRVWLWLGGIILTPLVLFLVAFGRHRQSGSTLPFRIHPWPLAAAAIAFAIWALSVPGVLDGELGLPAAFGALFISTLLSLLEPVFGPLPAPPDGGD